MLRLGRRCGWSVLLVAACGPAVAPVAARHAAGPPATPPPAPAPALVQFVFRPGPTSILVARMDRTWKESSRYQDGDLREIRFLRQQPSDASAKLLLTPMATVHDDRILREPSALREVVARQAAEMGPGAAEKTLPIEDVAVGAHRLLYFTATDAHPKDGEFLLATQGVLMLGGVPCSLTLLHNEVVTRQEVFATLARWAAFGAPNVVAQGAQIEPARVEEACRQGDGLACGLVQEMAAGDDAGAEGVKALTAGCAAGSAFACGSLGSLYAEGTGVAKDETRAMQIFAQGCDLHGWLACLNAGAMTLRDRLEGAPAAPEGLAYLDRACGYGGDREGVCRFSVDSDGPPARYLRAQTTGCAAGDGRACRLLGWAIETGYGDTPVDVDAARASYAKACAAHSLWGCFRQALLTADRKEQARLYEGACQQGSGPACYALAQPQHNPSPAARRALVRKACESSVVEACNDALQDLGR
jgi:TPR repeat protein